MTDVLKIALDRRAELSEEVAKLDEFIRMAELLIRNQKQSSGRGDDKPAAVAETDEGDEEQTSRPQVIRRSPAAVNG